VQSISEHGGHDLGDRPVILMGIIPPGSDYEVGRAISSHSFEDVLYALPNGGQPALRQVMEFDRQRGPRKEGLGGVARFELALGRPCQDHVAGLQTRTSIAQRQKCSPRSYLNVIRMCPNGKY
jgi:hypothetical protein